MSPNPFDQACRFLAKLEPAPFLGWLLDLPLAEFAFRRWLNTRLVRFPGESDRTCDTVAFLEDLLAGHLPWAVVVEFQIEPEMMFGRLLGYLAALWLEAKSSSDRGDRFQIGVVLVNLTGRGNSSRAMEWPRAGLHTALQIVERNLADYFAQRVLAEIAAGTAPAVILPLIPLMQGGGDAGMIRHWLQLAAAEPDARRRGEFGGLALVFAEAGGCHDAWKEALKEWNVIQSRQVQEWQSQARVEGRVEGRHEAAVESLLNVLETKFGAVPADWAARIAAIEDAAVLKRLLALAVRAASTEEFAHHIANGAH